ncbi:hypothetical protein BCR39DRAFT_541999 [Naematelia encephala]|uniref:Uncharacterized protein n=1 Tax=Naematelia encephala TaxID=71784 RepID=A0A1Y2AUC4_9TREE|nr:hypothetical protein BCR39DRAFT_541999 [Naematelia encephala]
MMSGTPPSSLTPPTSDSRSSSPAGDRPRLVSGSLKDRIAKFNNPSAAPLIPNHPFGLAGPAPAPASSTNFRGGLIGNRISSFDARTAGIPIPTGQRKISEQRGLIGNRIPSVSGGKVQGRDTSPAGSVDSSVHSAAVASSGSPNTSRSSSPSTSPGPGLPPSLLVSTLPDDIPTGAMTPSSTRAEAGDSTSEFSAPSTPVANAAPELPPPEYDLVPGNLRFAAAGMPWDLANSSGYLQSVAPSVASSLVSQYDPSSAGSETAGRMGGVSGISTPSGTPKAAHRQLDGSRLGEGSIRGEGSEVDELDVVARKLEGLDVDVPDRDPTPEPPTINISSDKEPLLYQDTPGPAHNPIPHEAMAGASDEAAVGTNLEHDPNTDGDLAALKAGELNHPPTDQVVDESPLEFLAQAGQAGTQVERSATPEAPKEPSPGELMGFLKRPDVIEEPSPHEADTEGVLEVREATPIQTEDLASAEDRTPVDDVPEAQGSEDAEDGLEEQGGDKRQRSSMSTDERKVVEDWQHSQGITYEASEAENAVEPDSKEITDQSDKPVSAAQLKTESEPNPILPTPPSGDPIDTPLARKPLQLHLEPAPIAQPLDEDLSPAKPTDEKFSADTEQKQIEEEDTDGETTPPAFPTAPINDFDDEPTDSEPPLSTNSESTPIDSSVLKSFPEVPDESKPRVEVHVQSPQSTPQKHRASFDANQTPLAILPGQSKSLNAYNSPPADADLDTTPQQNQSGLNKRHSTRRSPKSPLLDDEDPGDFEPGEGWAVVTKGRDQ